MSAPFPWIALFFASGIAFAQLAIPSIPLLTQLLMNELGFFLCLIGIGMGYKESRANGDRKLWIAMAGCGILAVAFLVTGLKLWPEGGLTAALQA